MEIEIWSSHRFRGVLVQTIPEIHTSRTEIHHKLMLEQEKFQQKPYQTGQENMRIHLSCFLSPSSFYVEINAYSSSFM